MAGTSWIKLDQAPVFASHCKNGIYFVQLYGSPYDGDTPEGKVAAERFKDAVGRETFYDPVDPEKILKAPDFHHLLQEY